MMGAMVMFLKLPFEYRLLLFAMPLVFVAWGVAWLLRLPLGWARNALAVLVGASILGAWCSVGLAHLILGPAIYWAGLDDYTAAATVSLIVFAADFIRLRTRNGDARRWQPPVETLAALLIGVALVRIAADASEGERIAGKALYVDHMRTHFEHPKWLRLLDKIVEHFPEETEAAIRRQGPQILGAIRAGDDAAIARANRRMERDFMRIPGSTGNWSKASSETLLKVARLVRRLLRLLRLLRRDPKQCADYLHSLGAPLEPEGMDAKVSGLRGELQLAEVEAFASGRDNAAAPARAPVSEADLTRLHHEFEQRLPPHLRRFSTESFVGKMEPSAECALRLALMEAILTFPDDVAATMLAQLAAPPSQ